MRDGGYSFSQVPQAQIPRSVFNRSHGHKTTFDAGLLIPIFVDEALPGDTFSVSASMFTRLATPLVPVMDNMVLDVFFFAVPNRLLWNNWQKMMGEQENPGDSTDFLVPEGWSPATGFERHTLADYFGLPTNTGGQLKVSALPFRAYNLIWNEWFRDENLQDRVVVNKDDGPDDLTTIAVNPLRRGKRHDYFTSCLPWPQKGAGVELPIGTAAPVIGTGSPPQFGTADGTRHGALRATAQSQGAYAPNVLWPSGATTNQAEIDPLHWYDSGLQVDLSSATSQTINSLRQAFQIQKLLERDARGGTRYTEILRAHFGVISPDSRLQRPEFLGGGSVPINFNAVSQTSGTASDPATGYTSTPQGNLAAYALGSGRVGFSKSFVEHCTILGLVCARADLSYQQGIPRMFSRRTRFDFYWPAFSHLGEQAVLRKEIYATGVPADDEQVFGYQERWAEYRYFPSKITGKFRSTDPQTLDFWHLAQEFTAPPVLGATFIEEHPPVDRIVAVTDEPQFIFDSYFKMKCVRPMPTYSVPGLIDHF